MKRTYQQHQGDPNYDCDSGLSCDDTFKVCLNLPRTLDQPCNATGEPSCAVGLSCEARTLRCVAPAEYNDYCNPAGGLPCNASASLSCAPTSSQCMREPRQLNEPCTGLDGTAAFSCSEGYACEVGVSGECRARGVAGEPCHATLPCADGYSCHPWIQKCYDAPRKLGQPCTDTIPCGQDPQLGDLQCDLNSTMKQCLHSPRLAGQYCSEDFPCADGLACDLWASFTCVRPIREGGHCWGTLPCKEGMSCSPVDQKCRYTPRQAGQDCGETPDQQCAPGLVCHPYYKICRETAANKNTCFTNEAGLSWACEDGLSCQSGFNRCYQSPRKSGEPCSADSPCAAGLLCDNQYPYCVPPPAT
ncbi:hypothetical protein N2152v2_000242 [Parachlorella kessleri]